jgi:hypothetical protein
VAKKVEKDGPGRHYVEVRMPAWLVLALGIWMTLPVAALLIIRGTV